MEAVLSFMKNFLVLTLILFVFSYLVPKESYQKYVQFFIGILMAVILLAPAAEWIFQGDGHFAYKSFDQIMDQLNEMEWDEESGEDIFEFFDMDSETG